MKDFKPVSIINMTLSMVILANIIVLRNGFIINDKWYWLLLVAVPMLAIVLAYSRDWKRSGKRMN